MNKCVYPEFAPEFIPSGSTMLTTNSSRGKNDIFPSLRHPRARLARRDRLDSGIQPQNIIPDPKGAPSGLDPGSPSSKMRLRVKLAMTKEVIITPSHCHPDCEMEGYLAHASSVFAVFVLSNQSFLSHFEIDSIKR